MSPKGMGNTILGSMSLFFNRSCRDSDSARPGVQLVRWHGTACVLRWDRPRRLGLRVAPPGARRRMRPTLQRLSATGASTDAQIGGPWPRAARGSLGVALSVTTRP